MASSAYRSKAKSVPAKTAAKTEFGDWQTPLGLATSICLLAAKRIAPDFVFEPNCGEGAFLKAAIGAFPQAKRFLGLEINNDYARKAHDIGNEDLKVIQGDFFVYDWKRHLDESTGPILIIGNPPWVTNAELMRIGSINVPAKSNINGFSGMDAITGKSNFDISEWMIIKEMEALQGKDALLAMLCKTAVARKVIAYAWKKPLFFADAEIRLIDAMKHFAVSVSACLLLIRFVPKSDSESKPCRVYNSLDAEEHAHTLGLRLGKIVSNTDIVDKHIRLVNDGQSMFIWRSGIKHDCSKVMELRTMPDGRLVNGFDELVDIEKDLLFPMLKSSEIANGNSPSINKYMLVTQRSVGSDTNGIASLYPKTWTYLQENGGYLDKRKSAIYRNWHRFSIFGIGDYSFAPWKVAISGLYKSLKFQVIGPYQGKPVVFDDTCYFLPFRTEEQAALIKELLDSEACIAILGSLIFWDSKRPITSEILNLVDLPAMACYYGSQDRFVKAFGSLPTTQLNLTHYSEQVEHEGQEGVTNATGRFRPVVPLSQDNGMDLAAAWELATFDPIQFQWWALGLVGARPYELKKGADKGIDGVLYFHDENSIGKTKSVVISVKSGHVGVNQIRELKSVVGDNKAEIGVFITLNPPTREMKTEAADAGFYESPGFPSKSKHPRIQILTIEQLLSGSRIDLPVTGAGNVTFQRAPKAKAKDKRAETAKLELE